MLKQNPFTPSFGSVPPLFIDKQANVADLIDELKNGQPQSYFITGVRGCGKSSYMNKVVNTLKQDKDCVCVAIANTDGLLTSLARKLYRANHRKMSKLFDVFDSVSIDKLALTRSHELLNVEDMLEELMISFQKQNKHVIIAIDDVSNDDPIRTFAKEYNLLKGAGYPIYVVMTGLPELVHGVQNNDALTFLLRSTEIEMHPLNEQAIVDAYQSVFDDYEVAAKLAQLSGGYSYGFQLLGDLYFKYLKKNECKPNVDLIKEVLYEYQDMLYRNAYQKIFMSISEMDQQYLFTVKDHLHLAEASRRLGKTLNYVSQYRRRMIDRNIVQHSSYGQVWFVLPFFDAYLDETQNPDSRYYNPLEISSGK